MPQKTDLLWILSNHWPGVVFTIVAGIAFFNWLGETGFIDGVVHESAFKTLKLQIDETSKRNDEAHAQFKEGLREIKGGLREVISTQNRQLETITRMEVEASRK